MTDLSGASQRFRRALDLLEQAVLPLADSRRSLLEVEKRVDALSKEKEQLLARIAELEDEARAATKLSERAERSVDNAIAEVRSALGR